VNRHPIIAALLTRRITLGLRQIDIATALGVSNKTISFWENGAKKPSFDNLVAWADFLGVDLALSVRQVATP
jgi:transcriptional regulator with XRE-family HTH domain